MKTRRLVTVFSAISLALITCCAAFAAPVFEENFNITETALVGDDISEIGWTSYGGVSDGHILLSDNPAIDGTTGKKGGTGGIAYYWKYPLPGSSSYNLSDGETVSITWASNTPGNSVTLLGFKDTVNASTCQIYNWKGTFYWYVGAESGSMAVPTDLVQTLTQVIDTKIELSKTATSFYYKGRESTSWSLMASTNVGVGNIGWLSLYEDYSDPNYIPSVDSIRIDSSLSAVPEPGTLLALSSGLIGLAGMAVRRRK